MNKQKIKRERFRDFPRAQVLMVSWSIEKLLCKHLRFILAAFVHDSYFSITEKKASSFLCPPDLDEYL
jgi:hypothetical protein